MTHGTDAAFLSWARQKRLPLAMSLSAAADLAPLGKMIGEASVVTLGEGTHFVAEPLELRNRLLQYLAEEKGFTAVALESGIVESRVVHDYVRGDEGELSDVVAGGITWTFDRLRQNHELVRWLRDFNSDSARVRSVNFYGFDVPGSPGVSSANRGVETALVESLAYLDRVNAAAGAAFHARFDPMLPNLRFDLFDCEENGRGYHRFSQAERDALTAGIADLIALFERSEAEYTATTSTSEYEWACRAAIGARQADGWLRHVPLDWRASGEQLIQRSLAADVRDRAQADNLEWILRREGPRGKVLVFAHNAHLSEAPMEWVYWSLDGGNERAASSPHQPAGTYLRRRLGDRLFSLAHLMGERASTDSVDGIASQAGDSSYLLDLRGAPPEIEAWLSRKRQIGTGFEYPGKWRVSMELALGKAFDAICYVDRTTPAQT